MSETALPDEVEGGAAALSEYIQIPILHAATAAHV